VPARDEAEEPADSAAITQQMAIPVPERAAAESVSVPAGSRRPAWIVPVALVIVALAFLLAQWC
jgi:hypothetical protein